jgi:hypothetical protein
MILAGGLEPPYIDLMLIVINCETSTTCPGTRTPLVSYIQYHHKKTLPEERIC